MKKINLKKTTIIKVFILIFYCAAIVVSAKYPQKSFYRISSIIIEPYTPDKHQIVKVSKKSSIIPGLRKIWAVRTETGYDFYRYFSDHITANTKPIFSITIAEINEIKAASAFELTDKKPKI